MIHILYFLKNPSRIIDAIRQRVTKIKNKYAFINKSKNTMAKVQEVLANNGYFFYFDLGTLLGLYRDGRLLRGDMDIDLNLFLKSQNMLPNLRELLRSNGFVHKYIFVSEELGVFQDTFSYEGVTVDINYYHQEGNKDRLYMLYDYDDKINEGLILSYDCCHHENTILYPFEDMFINIPDNTEQHLEERYGNTWRIPNPNYKYWTNPEAIKLSIKGRIERL